jgi:dephospho-CoA kinase
MIIGISGKIGSGKTTLANWIEKTKDFKQFAFADNIKKITAIVSGTSFKQNMNDGSFKPDFEGFEGKTLSKLHVEIGEDFRLKYGKKIWIYSLMSKIDKHLSEEQDVVISDVRTKAEANWLKEKYDAYLIRLKRPLYLRKKCLRGRNPNSKIECDLDDYEKFDCIIKNDTKNLNTLYEDFPLM